MREKLPPYMLGLIDGFEIAMRIHRRHFSHVPDGSPTLRRSLNRFRVEAQTIVDRMQSHRLGETAAFFGFDDIWTPERAARLRALAPLEVEVDEARSSDSDVAR